MDLAHAHLLSPLSHILAAAYTYGPWAVVAAVMGRILYPVWKGGRA